MSDEEMIERCPDIIRISNHIMVEVVSEVLNIDLDLNKTWDDNGLDDLDCVEMIIGFEKRLGISIPDDVADSFIQYQRKPPQFLQYYRNKKIEELGI